MFMWRWSWVPAFAGTTDTTDRNCLPITPTAGFSAGRLQKNFTAGALYGRRDPLLQLLLGRGADLTGCKFPVLEQHQGRDGHDAVLRRGRGVLVYVELYDLDLAVHRAGDLLERRRNHPARAAPFGPEVDHDRFGGLQDLGLEGGVRNLVNAHGSPRCCGGRKSRPVG